ncbi:hypothetical protein F3Y22_tig00002982pilonHSYRG00022 [Hibiscus syriacus]|uniref:NADP-dependent oxidoreductase domain-containing protein n=1 Tax=Hibiscus syriacus TaxID=106335 RepID=A0A6A3CSF0_HIBSY|nr:hypothetical protein F3Y22_tig00002982pilonHSYRG00022 [Hibiscus syriacus]
MEKVISVLVLLMLELLLKLEWSLWSRDVEAGIVPTCRELGIEIVAYSPLGRVFFSSGPKIVKTLSNDDSRNYYEIAHHSDLSNVVSAVVEQRCYHRETMIVSWPNFMREQGGGGGCTCRPRLARVVSSADNSN